MRTVTAPQVNGTSWHGVLSGPWTTWSGESVYRRDRMHMKIDAQIQLTLEVEICSKLMMHLDDPGLKMLVDCVFMVQVFMFDLFQMHCVSNGCWCLRPNLRGH